MGFETRPKVENKRAEGIARLQTLQREYVRLDEEIKQERHVAETAANGDPKLLKVINELEAPKVAQLLEMQEEMLNLEESLANDPAFAPETSATASAEPAKPKVDLWEGAVEGDSEKRGNKFSGEMF